MDWDEALKILKGLLDELRGSIAKLEEILDDTEEGSEEG
jgi:prefoldin subunit 5